MNISVQLLGPGYHAASPGTAITGAAVRGVASPVADGGIRGTTRGALLHHPGFPFPGPVPPACPRWADTRVLAPALPAAQWDPAAPAPSPRRAPGGCPAPAFTPLHARGPWATHGLSLLFCRHVPLPKSQLGSSAAAHLHPHPPARSSQLPFITLRFMRSAPVPPRRLITARLPVALGGRAGCQLLPALEKAARERIHTSAGMWGADGGGRAARLGRGGGNQCTVH